jgi:hypothetical protein
MSIFPMSAHADGEALGVMLIVERSKSVGRAALALAGALAALALASCATPPSGPCVAAGEHPTAELVFGRVSSGAPGVTEAQFAKFLQQEVGRRFPDGLTVVDAQGRWFAPAGGAIRGPSKKVMIVLRGGADDRDKLDAVRAAYTERFHQPSALLMADQSCVAA